MVERESNSHRFVHSGSSRENKKKAHTDAFPVITNVTQVITTTSARRIYSPHPIDQNQPTLRFARISGLSISALKRYQQRRTIRGFHFAMLTEDSPRHSCADVLLFLSGQRHSHSSAEVQRKKYATQNSLSGTLQLIENSIANNMNSITVT
jgi:hypothetical protein